MDKETFFKYFVSWGCGIIIGMMILAFTGNVCLIESQEENVKINKLQPKCFEYVNDKGCTQKDANTRECFNIPRKVQVDCDAPVSQDAESNKNEVEQ